MRAQGSITISCLTIYITGLSIISMFLKSTRYSINPSYISVGWYCFCLLSFLISLLFIKTTGGTIIFTIGSFLRKTRRTTLTTKFFWHNMLNFTVHLHPLLFHSQLFLLEDSAFSLSSFSCSVLCSSSLPSFSFSFSFSVSLFSCSWLCSFSLISVSRSLFQAQCFLFLDQHQFL